MDESESQTAINQLHLQINEIKRQITTLEQQITTLEQQITAIEQQITALEQQITTVEQISGLRERFQQKCWDSLTVCLREVNNLGKQQEQLQMEEIQLRNEKAKLLDEKEQLLKREVKILELFLNQKALSNEETFPKLGLPPLGKSVVSLSAPSLSDPYVQRNFGSYTGMLFETRVLWVKYSQNTFFKTVHFKQTCHGFVQQVLLDAAESCQLLGKLRYEPEVSSFRYRSGFNYIVAGGRPVGVVAIRQCASDRSSVLRDSRFNAQVFDALMRLKALHGLQRVFGIITTYTEWRIVWIPDDSDDDTAAEEVLHEFPPQPQESTSESIVNAVLRACQDSGAEDHEEKEAGMEHVEVNEEPPSAGVVLHASQVYSFDDKRLPRVLCAALMKMYASTVDVESYRRPGQLAAVLTQSQWHWTRLPKTLAITRLKLQLPNEDVQRCTLLGHLGTGRDGSVWLARGISGDVFSIKLPHKDSKIRAEREAKLWQLLNGVSVHVQQLAGKHALLMPYVTRLSAEQRYQIAGGTGELYESMIAAITRMASHGWCHSDLAFRNMGLLKSAQGDSHQFVLLDFVDAKKMDCTKAMKRMEQILRGEMDVNWTGFGLDDCIAGRVESCDAASTSTITKQPTEQLNRPKRKRRYRVQKVDTDAGSH